MESEAMKERRKELEFNVHKAVWELSQFFKAYDDPLQYEVNRLYRRFDELRAIPFFPRPETGSLT